MKKLKKIITLLVIIILSIGISSCSKKDDVTTVKVKIISNTPGVPISVNGTLGYFIIKDKWENTFVAKSTGVHFEAQCDEETVLITIEIYVNGKLEAKKFGNESVSAGVVF